MGRTDGVICYSNEKKGVPTLKVRGGDEILGNGARGGETFGERGSVCGRNNLKAEPCRCHRLGRVVV